MGTVQKSIVVDLPVTTVYNQWTQFEEFPEFMEGVQRVTQVDDTRLHWVAEIAGKREEWDAEIIDQTPDRRISWQAVGGKTNAGTVTFQPQGATSTQVGLDLAYEPEGVVEKAGDALGVVSRRVEGDLERFKSFIESRGVETGGWRGQV